MSILGCFADLIPILPLRTEMSEEGGRERERERHRQKRQRQRQTARGARKGGGEGGREIGSGEILISALIETQQAWSSVLASGFGNSLTGLSTEKADCMPGGVVGSDCA